MKNWLITLLCLLGVFGLTATANATVLTWDNANGTLAGAESVIPAGYGAYVKYTIQDGFSYASGTHGATPDVNVAYIPQELGWEGTVATGSPYADLVNIVYPWLDGLGGYADMQFTFIAHNGKSVRLYGFDVGADQGDWPTDYDILDGNGNLLTYGTVTFNYWADPNFQPDPNHASIPGHHHAVIDANLADSGANGKLVLILYTSTWSVDAPHCGIDNIEFGQNPPAAPLAPQPVAPVVLTFNNADGSLVGGFGPIPQDYGDQVISRPQNGYTYGGTGVTPDIDVAYIAPLHGILGYTDSYSNLMNIAYSYGEPMIITFTGLNGKKAALYGFDLGAYGATLTTHWQVSDGATILAQGDATMPPYKEPATHIGFDPILKADVLTLTIDEDGNGNFAIDNIGFGQDPAFSGPMCGDSNHPKPMYDFNGDCHVNFADLAIFLQHWLACTDPQPPCNYVAP